MNGTEREEALVKANNYTCRDCSKVTFIEFVEIMRLQSNEQVALQLFRIYDKVCIPCTLKEHPVKFLNRTTQA